MKISANKKSQVQKITLHCVVAIGLIIGLVGSYIYAEDPVLRWVFRPGILYFMAIVWGFYLGITYKPEKK